ncbi:MAG TPA: hypothetical protein VFR84_03805, partial [Candidatus Angelobacter sp.]|nr:hypothetical protein [Candidatus Angelobacter sp.]
MNLRILLSPSKKPVSVHLGKKLSWRKALLIVHVALFCFGAAFASPGTLVANGVNQPNGAIRYNGSVWVADIANGFCRIDNGAENLATCFTRAQGQPELYGNTIFISDQTGATGVWRLAMNAVTSTIDTAVVLAPNGGLAGSQPTSVSMGADGKLYVAFNASGDIKRITNPFGDPLAQQVEQVGKAASGGGPVRSITFMGDTLFLADTGAIGMERITGASTCRGNCNATTLFGTLGISNSISSDRTRYIYMENGTRVLRYDTTTTNSVVIYSSYGLQNGQQFGYGTIWGVSVDQPTGDVFVGGDPTAPGAATANRGSLYVVIAPATTEGIVDTGFGGPAPVPSPTPAPTPARTGSLYASGLTQPLGMNWLGTHAWISDKTQGFCRIDPSSPGVAALSNCFKPSGAFVPGQASFDSSRNLIYIPDAATTSAGIYRVAYDPILETLGAFTNLGNGNLTPTAVAVAADGSLFIGARSNGNINKITTPYSTPSAPVRVATTSNGQGVRAAIFVGNDLYLAETVNVTVIIRASPSLTKGKAVIVGPAQTRGATPLLNVTTPLSLVADMT